LPSLVSGTRTLEGREWLGQLVCGGWAVRPMAPLSYLPCVQPALDGSRRVDDGCAAPAAPAL